jgi:BirA family biotin operon repressor/biotin-[acetyl-CoA-carboxylase] ligase
MPDPETFATVPEGALDASGVAIALGEHASRFRLDIRGGCTSTNTLLLEQAERGAPGRSVVACNEQSAGRGRRGRTWLSCGAHGLTFSLLWRFPAADFPPTGLSLAVGVALAQALEALGAGGVALKWPNDVLLRGRKLAGVLIELLPGSDMPAAVIGVGLNLRLPPDFLQAIPAAGLAETLAELPTRSQLLARLLLELEAALAAFDRAGFAAFRESWMTRCAHLDAPVTLIGDGGGSEGVCRGVDDDGALLLQTAAGLQRVVSGDVSLRPC